MFCLIFLDSSIACLVDCLQNPDDKQLYFFFLESMKNYDLRQPSSCEKLQNVWQWDK